MSIIEEMIDKIQRAEVEAIKKGIETNTVIINDKFDWCHEFAVQFTSYFGRNDVRIVPPMILGKEIIVAPLPEDYSFALTYTNGVGNYVEELEERIKLLTKYIRVKNGELKVLKRVKKRDIKKIKELL